LAEYAVADAGLVVPVPDGVSLGAACVVPGALTTAELLLYDLARISSGDVIIVHSAAGAVGAGVAAFARRTPGIRLIGVVGASERIPAAQAHGYEAVFIRSDGLAEEVCEYLGGRGGDVVLDPQGTRWLDVDLAMLASTGRIVLFGNASGVGRGQLPVGTLYGANASVAGFSLAAMSAHDPERVRAAMSRVLDRIAADAAIGDHIVVKGLEMAADAQQRLASGTGEGKYVVHVRPDE
jgi:NADPH2:quinone reductase